jgi:hypothetical protein
MFQHEIESAVRQATAGRWTIESRSPKSAIATIVVDASKLRAEVERLQFTEHYQILSITCADHDDDNGCCDNCGQWANQS